MSQPLVSIILVNYNGKDDLDTCLSSIMEQVYSNIETILVDNHSRDGSAEYVKRQYPWVKLIESSENIGYALGNNLGSQYANGDYLVILNVDIELEKHCIEHLVTTIRKNELIKIVTPKILLFHDRTKINACGNFIQFTGHAGSRGLYQDQSNFSKEELIACPSGACFIVLRSDWENLQGFDVSLFQDNITLSSTSQNYYLEADFTWKLLALGYKCVFQPQAMLYHKYRAKPITAERLFDLEITHWTFVLNHFQKRILLLSIPGFAFSELLSIFFALLKGFVYWQGKMRAYRWLWKNRFNILQKRKRVQSNCKISDNRMFNYLVATTQFSHQYRNSRSVKYLEKIINFIYTTIYHSVRMVLGLISFRERTNVIICDATE